MSDSVRPHRRQPTRVHRPWDSPGKNIGVGCHFLLQCMKVKSKSEVTQSCLTQRPHGLQPTRLLHPWDFPGKSTGVGCHCLLRDQISLAISKMHINSTMRHPFTLSRMATLIKIITSIVEDVEKLEPSYIWWEYINKMLTVPQKIKHTVTVCITQQFHS